MNRVPHIVWAMVALVIVLCFWFAAAKFIAPTPKLLDLAIVIGGAVVALARTDIPPGSDK